MKKLFAILVFLLCATSLHAQSTVVSGQIIAADSQSWNNGSYLIQFYPPQNNPTGPFQWNGQPFSRTQLYSGKLNGTGSFTQSVPSNNAISPGGSQWQFTVCPNATSACYTEILAVNGATFSVTNVISPPAVAINMQNPPPAVHAYLNSELIAPTVGQSYWNVTQDVLYYWDGFMWVPIGGGGGGSCGSSFTQNSILYANTTSSCASSLFNYEASAGVKCSSDPCQWVTDNGSSFGSGNTMTVTPDWLEIDNPSVNTQIMNLSTTDLVLGKYLRLGTQTPPYCDWSNQTSGIGAFECVDTMSNQISRIDQNGHLSLGNSDTGGGGSHYGEITLNDTSSQNGVSMRVPNGICTNTGACVMTFYDSDESPSQGAGVQPFHVAVSELPSAASFPGAMFVVSDSTSIMSEGQTCTGSSSNTALAFSNGSSWKCF